MIQQPALHRQQASIGVTREATQSARCHDPVTGHQDGAWIRAAGLSDRAWCAAETPREHAIGQGLAERDPHQFIPDATLKRGSLQPHGQREAARAQGQIIAELASDRPVQPKRIRLG